jgi:hypothetical protein
MTCSTDLNTLFNLQMRQLPVVLASMLLLNEHQQPKEKVHEEELDSCCAIHE